MDKRLRFDSEQFKGCKQNLQEALWGDLHLATRQWWKEILEADSEARMERYLGLKWYERAAEGPREDSRNGWYERDYSTILGPLRLRIRRTRKRSFLPAGVKSLRRRAPELEQLIKEAFLKGISTRQVGPVVALITEEAVSAQTVSRLTRSLDGLAQQFHRRLLKDEWAYLLLDGVYLKVRQQGQIKRTLLLVAYGIRADGSRELIDFMRAHGESQAGWEGFLNNLYHRGLRGEKLQLIVTDGCAGLATALQTVYPRVQHQRCWVHKMRNVLERVKKREQAKVKAAAQRIYLAKDRQAARQAFLRFKLRWRTAYPGMVKQLERDLPELLNFYSFPKSLWRKLRTTNAIERSFVEVRRRTRPMVTFVNMASVDRIIFAIFNAYNQKWGKCTLQLFTQAA
jgi:putative transposase